MECKVMRLADIVPAEYNPRVTLTEADFEYKALKASIDEFGLVVPLVVNERTGILVSGHQRLNVMLKNGVEETEVVVVDMEPEKEKALCVALNKIKGDWDMEKLAYLLGDDEVSAFPTGFDEGEVDLEKYLKNTEPVELPDEQEEAPEPEAEEKEATTVIKIGGFSFTVKASEYYALIDDIRDNGIFEPTEIRAELQRRILND